MSPEEFDGLLDNEIQQAVWWQDSAIKTDRERNYQYYLGLPLGNEVAGRSQVVSWDVFEVVESTLPDLLEMFFAGDNTGEFDPEGPDGERYAQQATDYVNYLIRKQNPGFLIFNTWFKDALIAKLGVVRAYWNPQEKVTRENYQGLDEASLVMLLDNDGVEVIDQLAYPDPQDMEQRQQAESALNAMAPEQAQQVLMMLQQPPKMLYDVSVKVTRKRGQVCIDNVRPETFIVSKRATKLGDAGLQGEVRPFMRSDLIEMGVSRADAESVQDYDLSILETGESLKERAEHSTNTWQFNDEQTIDKSTEEVLLFCGHVLADFDGDGIAEWRYVLRGGNKTLTNEESDGPDYCVLTPIPIPHAIFGLSLADTVAPIQEANTALTRQYLDSLYLANNPRTYAVDNQVNLDDLLDNRIGGVVRMKNPGMAGPLETSSVAGEALQGIEFMDSRRENRTGVTRYNQGLDADSLNKTATGVSKIMGAGDRRMRMIARIFAETGVKDLFKLVLKIVCQHQDHEAVIKLRGEWVSFNPREWSDQMEATIEVGTDDHVEMAAMWQQIIGMQAQAVQAGSSLANEKNIFNSTMQLMKAMRVKGAERFWTDPDQAPPKEPPPPSPEQILAQAEVEKAKIKAESDRAKMASDERLEQIRLQIELVKLRQKEAEIGIKDRDSMVNAAVAADEQERKDRQQNVDTLHTAAQFGRQSQQDQHNMMRDMHGRPDAD
ncbi:hypothetical protein [Cupriavidus necator]|uniref:portal protein n=1 Tax=Cupriavidus necator TaxID=106590 RepID=UPI00339D53B5